MSHTLTSKMVDRCMGMILLTGKTDDLNLILNMPSKEEKLCIITQNRYGLSIAHIIK